MKIFEKNTKQHAKHAEIKCENIVVVLDKIEDKSVVKMSVKLVEPEKRYDYSEAALIMNREIPVAIGKVPEFFPENTVVLLDNSDYLLAHVYSALAYYSIAKRCIIAKRKFPDKDKVTYIVERSYDSKIKENDIFDADGNLIPVQEPIVTYN